MLCFGSLIIISSFLKEHLNAYEISLKKETQVWVGLEDA